MRAIRILWKASRVSRSCSSVAHQQRYDAVIVGGGHNGLVAAAYLARAGKKVAVFEKRHILGGAAVTEEIVPGFKFSRASYLLSLLRPVIVKDLELKKHGLKVYLRDPDSYTPHLETREYLLLGSDVAEKQKQIGKFSAKDASVYLEYEAWLERIALSIDPLLDTPPLDLTLANAWFWKRWSNLKPLFAAFKTGTRLKYDVPSFFDLLFAPASKILKRWFEGEILRATLATDALIGAMMSPRSPGSGYVLLHHVMGEMEGKRNAWGYPEGGMGAVSTAIGRAAKSHGAKLFTDKPVKQVLVEGERAVGIVLEDGSQVRAKLVLSNATPKITYLDLLPKGTLPLEFEHLVSSIDYTSPVTKISVALSGLPNFSATPTQSGGSPMPHHQCSIHLNCESMDTLHQAFIDCQQGIWSRKPLLELAIPSSLDPTLAPNGCHVMSIFSQFTPYTLSSGAWTPQDKEDYASHVFDNIEEYAPGFRKLVIGKEVLTPSDLERVFGLTGGNIFHGSMSMDQLYNCRPTYLNPHYGCPLPGLYLCGSGAHPGGGVMGAPGRLAALTALRKEF